MTHISTIAVSAGLLALFLAFAATADAQAPPPRFTWDADLRTGYFGQHREDRNGTAVDTDNWRARLRMGTGVRLDDAFSLRVRVAGRFASDQDSGVGFVLRDHAVTSDGLRFGEMTVDEAYLNYRPSARWNIRVGRMQTKFALADLMGKSLDRVDSPNTAVNWTDGAHITFSVAGGWRSHLIVQHNAAAGPSNVLRSPLAFDESRSRLGFFAAMENPTAAGAMVQRSLDLTYLPGGLRMHGMESDDTEDYLAGVARGALAWPVIRTGARLLVGGELGYAPNTPTRASMQLGEAGDRDVGGLALHLAITLADAIPGHAFGLVYGYVEAGWLIAPDFRNNDRLIEARYKWTFGGKHSIDARLRRRQDLERLVNAERRREDVDVYVRFSARF